MDGPLICSLMRKRSDWVSLFPALLQGSHPKGRWREARLDTHDVAIPLTLSGRPSHIAFRAICLSPADIGLLETRKRIERLYNLNGGQFVAIVFLMKEFNGETGSHTMMKLQMELVGGLEMPIIPVSSPEALPTAIEAFHHQLMTSAAPVKQPDSVRSLLPHCSGIRTLPEHTVNILSDITTDLRDLMKKATIPEGQQYLKDYLGQGAEIVIKFWEDEYLVE